MGEIDVTSFILPSKMMRLVLGISLIARDWRETHTVVKHARSGRLQKHAQSGKSAKHARLGRCGLWLEIAKRDRDFRENPNWPACSKDPATPWNARARKWGLANALALPYKAPTAFFASYSPPYLLLLFACPRLSSRNPKTLSKFFSNS